MKIKYENKFYKNLDGYYLKKYNIENPNIDLGVQATYVIHLLGNGRLDSINEQFSKFRIVGHNYILYNQGYKCGKKNAIVKSPGIDLINAYLYIFSHAKKKKYENIIILEDDFFFSDNILVDSQQKAIKDFIKNPFYNLYYLGCLPYIRNPINNFTSRLYLSTGTHGIIYSLKFIENSLKITNRIYDITDWDIYLTLYTRYMSSIPLCYQLFPETPNRKDWGSGFMINDFMGLLVKQFIKIQVSMLNFMYLDKTHKIGYPFFYYVSLENYKTMKIKYDKNKEKLKTIKNTIW